jgi:hypothetical protein
MLLQSISQGPSRVLYPRKARLHQANKTTTVVRQGEEKACRAMLIGDPPSTHPARETRGAKAAWWWASRKVSSGQGLHRRLQKWEMRGRRGSSLQLREQLSGFIQGTCCLFFLWSKPKHHFDPISADSAWQRQFRLL